jgi:choline dehydrogenase-like flavoprotein
MNVADLNHLENDSLVETDLCIVGTGPTGLSIASEFANTRTNMLLLESGGSDREPETHALYDIESEPPRQMDQSILRARMLGGSSHIWTGRCAPFHELDFEKRHWIPNSGWPLTRAEFEPLLGRAGKLLGLGPNRYDDQTLWSSFQARRPSPPLNTELVEPMFWQFSKSPRDPKLSLDFGRDRLNECDAPNIRLLIHANVTHINTNAAGDHFESVEIRTLQGKRARVRSRALVLCCGGVENARILLASNRIVPCGVGNQQDTVGRYLMDHSDSVVGNFDPENSAGVRSRFGHYWLDNSAGRHVYLHGLALSPRLQERERLLNCHVYVDAFDVHADDPFAALDRAKKALQSRRDMVGLKREAGILMVHSGELLRGLYRRRFEHRPQLEKLTRVELHCILEQIPDRESRVTLSPTRKDALGVPLSKIDWKIGELELQTARWMTQIVCDEFNRLGLPVPLLTQALDDYGSWKANCVEKAHPTGTTRMSDDPKKGVVDRNGQVHGVEGLFISGSSIFPTSGAANPTLMIVANALRQADWLKSRRIGQDAPAVQIAARKFSTGMEQAAPVGR